MKVFISWSGPESRQIALLLRDWLPKVIQAIDPYMSRKDNEAGAVWDQVVASELEETDFGIICLTPDNLESTWIHFEAGALSKSISNAHVVPLMHRVTPADVKQPLTRFMMKENNREGIWDVLTTINPLLAKALGADQLASVFETWWPQYESQLAEIQPPDISHATQRDSRELLEEILGLVRALQPVNDRALSDIFEQLNRVNRSTLAAGINFYRGEQPVVVGKMLADFVRKGAPEGILDLDVVGWTIHLVYASLSASERARLEELEKDLLLLGYKLHVVTQT